MAASFIDGVGSDMLSSHLSQSGLIELLPTGNDVLYLWYTMALGCCSAFAAEKKDQFCSLSSLYHYHCLIFGVTY